MGTGVTSESVHVAVIGFGEAVSPVPAVTLVTVPEPPPPGGAAHVPSARRKFAVPPPEAGTTPAAAVVKVLTAKVRLADRSPPPLRGAVVEMVRVAGAAPRAVRAAAAVVEAVPPLAIATGIASDRVPVPVMGEGEADRPVPAATEVTVPPPEMPPEMSAAVRGRKVSAPASRMSAWPSAVLSRLVPLCTRPLVTVIFETTFVTTSPPL